jgi:hypothetical protein
MTPRFFVLAEDNTDALSIAAIIRRQLREHPKIKPQSGKGCARLRRKAHAWLQTAAKAGFNRAILIHDLDRDPNTNAPNDVEALRVELEDIPCPSGIIKHVCIPVEELEAWFWSDPRVLAEVAKKPVSPSVSPHNISRPKEKLRELSRGANRKPRYSTQDNPRLADLLDLELCASRCDSMRQLLDFIGS